MPLISVNQDLSSDGGAPLIASQSSVFVNNKAVIIQGDSAPPDANHDTNTSAASGSSNVFVTNVAVHRKNDKRADGDDTIVVGQSNVYANG